MQIEPSQPQSTSFINVTNGSSVDFETIQKASISSVLQNKDLTKGNSAGIVLQSEESPCDTNTIWQQFSRVLKNSDADWAILNCTGAKNDQGLPEVTRFFDDETITDASFYSGIIRKRMFRFIFTLGASTLLVILLLCGLSFYPFFKQLIDFALTRFWLSGTVICIYLLFISWKVVSLINSKKKSTFQAFNTAVKKNDPTTIRKLHDFYTKRILTHFKQPVAIFAKDPDSLDKFSRDVLFKVLTSTGDKNSAGGLLFCFYCNLQGNFYKHLVTDQTFNSSISDGKFTILKTP
jgi:hypothetical protein